jgi:hypothetical protein
VRATSRREFAVGLLAGMAWSAMSRSSLGQNSEARLLVIRNIDYLNRCTRCIPGTLYGVPLGIDLATAELLPALLTRITDVIEPSYEDNMPGLSSIPVGTYPATVRADGTKKWMWTGGAVNQGDLILDRAWRLQLSGVPDNRSAIQFHYGKDASWSAGCIIVGQQPANQCVDECKFADSPAAGVRAMREYVEGALLSSDGQITIRIADAIA